MPLRLCRSNETEGTIYPWPVVSYCVVVVVVVMVWPDDQCEHILLDLVLLFLLLLFQKRNRHSPAFFSTYWLFSSDKCHNKQTQKHLIISHTRLYNASFSLTRHFNWHGADEEKRRRRTSSASNEERRRLRIKHGSCLIYFVEREIVQARNKKKTINNINKCVQKESESKSSWSPVNKLPRKITWIRFYGLRPSAKLVITREKKPTNTQREKISRQPQNSWLLYLQITRINGEN